MAKIRVFLLLGALLGGLALAQPKVELERILGIGQSNAAIISVDATLVATTGPDQHIYLWSVPTRSIKTTFDNQVYVHELAIQPGNRRLAAALDSGNVALWDTLSGRAISSLPNPDKKPALDVIFSRDGKWLASGYEDGTVRLWRGDTLAGVAKISAHKGGVYSIAFSPDSQVMATGDEKGNLSLWNVDKRSKIADLKGHTGLIREITFSRDGKWMAVAGADGFASLWDARTRKQVQKFEVDEAAGSVSFNFNSTRLAYTGLNQDNTINIYDITTRRTSPAFSAPTSVYAVSYDANNRLIGVAPDAIRILDPADQEDPVLVGRHADEIFHLALDATKNFLWITYYHISELGLMDLATGETQYLSLPDGLDPSVIEPLPDGRFLLTSLDGTLALLEGGKPLQRWEVAKTTYALSYNPEARMALVTTDKDPALVFLSDGTVKSLKDGGDVVAVSPEGSMIATAKEGQALLWDATSQQVTAKLTLEGETPWEMAFSPDGRRLLIGMGSGVIQVWDVETQKLVQSLEQHQEGIWAIRLTKDGKYFLSTSDDGTAILWDAQALKPLATLEDFADNPRRAAFSPDGKRIYIGAKDGRVYVYRIAE